MDKEKKLFVTFVLLFGFCLCLEAKQINPTTEVELLTQAKRFLQMEDPFILRVILGSILMGVSCGLIGSYVVTRRLSLFGDTLSHALLPGVAVGFVWSGSKDNLSLLIGAMFAGFLGVSCLSILRKIYRIQGDSSLGIVLSAFYAVGICMLTRIQKLGFSQQSGLESFMFGQVSAISSDDLYLLLITLVIIGSFVFLNYRQLLASGFDPQFSQSIGIPTEFLQYMLWVLISFCIISSLQLVGVILVSAMLVIPAATASLLSKRMNSYLLLSCCIGAGAGFGGAFLSFLGNNLPTGPLIVLVSASFFLLVLLFRPEKGLFLLWLKSRSENSRIAIENTLKAAYQIIEKKDFRESEISFFEMMQKRGLSSPELTEEVSSLKHAGLATICHLAKTEKTIPLQNIIILTPRGWDYACRIVRNHRLWELYLTNEAQYAPDHVHEDAEKIEHIIGEKTVRKLERLLKNPKKDPHGKLIPSITDVHQENLPPKS